MNLKTLFFLLCIISATSFYNVTGQVIYKDFAVFRESDWVAVREPGFSAAGRFVQRNGYIENYYPSSADTSKMFRNEIGYSMRILKGVEVMNGKVEMELLLMGYAAPSIFLRARVAGDKHYEAYNCVIFNFTTSQKRYQGINLWAYRNGWTKVKAFDLDIPKYQKIRYAVEIVDNKLTFYFNDKLVGSYTDPDPFPKGSVGMCSIEGPNYFYNFRFTPYDPLSTSGLNDKVETKFFVELPPGDIK
jgi:hypothetical protein